MFFVTKLSQIYSCNLATRMAMRTASSFFFTEDGVRLEEEDFLKRISSHSGQVILVGENHSDPTGHSLEKSILKRVHKEAEKRLLRLALSLEFFDREAQTVMDEYVKGLVSNQTFLSDSRPPSNAADYQSLVNFCRENNIRVVAANCPRRYTKMVSLGGRDALANCISANPSSAHLLPPLPYPVASPEYRASFIAVMKELRDDARVPESLLDAQSLWDATMADSIHKALDDYDLVIHISGYFHLKRRLGILEHLTLRRPEVNALTVIIMPEENPDIFDYKEHQGLGDLIALTDLDKVQ